LAAQIFGVTEFVQPGESSASGLAPAQLDELREILLTARAETLARLRDEEELARSAEGFPEPMDAAELAREQGDAAERVERSREQLRDIDDALAKMHAGTYGVSEASGSPIGFARLRAVPWARLAADEEVGEE
jgi:DnaK suppressor protein